MDEIWDTGYYKVYTYIMDTSHGRLVDFSLRLFGAKCLMLIVVSTTVVKQTVKVLRPLVHNPAQ